MYGLWYGAVYSTGRTNSITSMNFHPLRLTCSSFTYVLTTLLFLTGKGEPKKPLNHTNSAPLTVNGQRNGNHPVLNGSLSVFKNSSHGDINIGQGQVNGKDQNCNENVTKGYISDDFASLKSTQTKSCFDLSTTKGSVNIDQEHNVHGDTDMMKCKSVGNVNQESERPVSEGPVPPRRPVRKKRSSRGRNDMPERVVLERNKQTLGKMAMDYSSSSPDISPRLSGTITQQNMPGRKLSGTLLNEASTNSESVKFSNGQSEGKKTMTGKEEDINFSVSNISNVSKHFTSSKCNSSTEEPSRDISLLVGRKEISNQSKIIEIGSEDSGKELEIERVDFDSQRRHFEQPNLMSSCFTDTLAKGDSSDNLKHSKIDELISGKTEEKSTRSEQLISEGQIMGQDSNSETLLRPSRSLESLEDIDRLLKQQVRFHLPNETSSNLLRHLSDIVTLKYFLAFYTVSHNS